MKRCRQGDVLAFEALYRRHANRLYNLAFRMSGNAADAEDLLQDIFLTAYRKLGSFKGESALGTWLYRLGLNLCLDHLRSRATKERQQTGPIDDDERLPGPRPATTRPIGAIEPMDLERAVGLLPAGCRAAFVLHDIEGFEHHEIAEMLGIATGTSKSQVHKARLRVRAYLTRQGGDTNA